MYLGALTPADLRLHVMSAAKFADGSAPDAKRQRSSYSEKTTGFQLKNSNLADSEQASSFVTHCLAAGCTASGAAPNMHLAF